MRGSRLGVFPSVQYMVLFLRWNEGRLLAHAQVLLLHREGQDGTASLPLSWLFLQRDTALEKRLSFAILTYAFLQAIAWLSFLRALHMAAVSAGKASQLLHGSDRLCSWCCEVIWTARCTTRLLSKPWVLRTSVFCAVFNYNSCNCLPVFGE